ncbi:glycosyltransferase family 2 protein [Holdemania massiliensis]|uniref:glycosyltransferase family 2 protein n=1 Tax=Holdemania massiliensis TaxID=1468449 RepID=UPI0035620BE1
MIDISVVIPVFRVEKYIKKCIESLINQSYTHFEIVLVDDGNDDNSIEIAINLLNIKMFSNYKVIRQVNKGLASARNIGLKQITSEYVIFVDSDDVVHKDFLKTLRDNMRKNDDMSICSFSYIKEQRSELLHVTRANIIELTTEDFLRSYLYRDKSLLVVSILFRRKFLIANNLFFNENMKFSEDQMFLWKCIFSSNMSVYTTAKLYGYFLRPNSIMTSSKYDTISKSCELYKIFCREMNGEYKNYSNICKYIYPRWCLGVLFSSAKTMKKNEYKELYYQLEGRHLLFKLFGFKEVKAVCLSVLVSLSINLSYDICRRVKL